MTPKFIAAIILITGLASCSKKEDHQAAVTHTRESLLCLEAWNYDHLTRVKTLRDKIVDEYDGPAWGRIEFSEGNTVDILEPGKTTSTLSWRVKADSLFIGSEGYAILNLSGKRLELERTTRRLTEKGVEVIRTETKMIR